MARRSEKFHGLMGDVSLSPAPGYAPFPAVPKDGSPAGISVYGTESVRPSRGRSREDGHRGKGHSHGSEEARGQPTVTFQRRSTRRSVRREPRLSRTWPLWSTTPSACGSSGTTRPASSTSGTSWRPSGRDARGRCPVLLPRKSPQMPRPPRCSQVEITTIHSAVHV